MSQITIKLPTSEERFAGAGDVRLVPFVAAIVREDNAARKTALAARLKLGSVLWQLREQLERGEWAKLMGTIGLETNLHRTSLLNALKISAAFANEAGELSDERWRQRQADIKLTLNSQSSTGAGRSDAGTGDRPSSTGAGRLTPTLAAVLDVAPERASIRQAVTLAEDSHWEDAPEMTPEMEAAILEGDRCGYDEDGMPLEADEAFEDEAEDDRPLVVGEQLTLASLYEEINTGVMAAVQEATSHAPEVTRRAVDAATQRYLKEVSAICASAHLQLAE